jgi:hypothetical protein
MGADAVETVILFRLTANIQVVALNEIKDLVVHVDVIYRFTIYFTQIFVVVWIQFNSKFFSMIAQKDGIHKKYASP